MLKEIKNQNSRIKWIISGLDWDDLTQWEGEFMESIEGQSDGGKLLSEKQIDIVESMYREKGR